MRRWLCPSGPGQPAACRRLPKRLLHAAQLQGRLPSLRNLLLLRL
jgi:hypothetical protein